MGSHKKLINVDRGMRVGRGIQDMLQMHGIHCAVCGSLRRGNKAYVNDVDLVVEGDLEIAKEIILSSAMSANVKVEVLSKTVKKSMDVLVNDVQVNIINASPESWGASIMYLTGSMIFNIVMRGLAKKQGMKLNRYGLFLNDEVIAGKSEEQIFMALGLPYIEPKDREDGKILKQFWEEKGEIS